MGPDRIGHSVQFEYGLVAQRLDLPQRADEIKLWLVDPGPSLFEAYLAQGGDDFLDRHRSALREFGQALSNLVARAETVEAWIFATAVEHRTDIIARVIVMKDEVGCEDEPLELARISRIPHAEAL
jgi:hypothetical protein